MSAHEPLDPTLGNSSFAGKFGEDVAEQFGANEWLVDEMYERYLQDPSSLDKAWLDFFAEFTPGSQATHNVAAPQTPHPGTPPTPRGASAQPVLPERTLVQSQPQAIPAHSQEPSPTQPVVRQSDLVTPTPADPIVKPAPVLATPEAASVVPLRGVAGRVVQSMEASLSVPTATSVRAVPAKLLIDNRIVINNHLKRARGGKVSFTHLIAYAMIKALDGGDIVVMTPDVPKVARVSGLGIIALARLSGRPIVPIVVATSRRVDLNNWDKTSICLPFSRGVMMMGEPIHVARDADEATQEAARQMLETRLDAIHDHAYATLGTVDPGAALKVINR